MSDHLSERTRWAIVMSFAIAMAWVEAASVFYIRALVDRIEPYQAEPLPMNGVLGNVELWREAATLVMIATLGFGAIGFIDDYLKFIKAHSKGLSPTQKFTAQIAVALLIAVRPCSLVAVATTSMAKPSSASFTR